MLAVTITVALCAAPSSATGPTASLLMPTDRITAQRLSAFILTKHKHPKRKAKVAVYAAHLAERIVIEAKRNRIPVTTLAAIAWAESWFWRWTKGTSYEYGVWQIWPYSDAVKRAWLSVQKAGLADGYPAKPWGKLGHRLRRKAMGDIAIGTALAAHILRELLRWCRSKHKVFSDPLLGSRRHRYNVDRAAHYNSGRKWPRPVYYFQLRRYSRKLRAVLYGGR